MALVGLGDGLCRLPASDWISPILHEESQIPRKVVIVGGSCRNVELVFSRSVKTDVSRMDLTFFPHAERGLET